MQYKRNQIILAAGIISGILFISACSNESGDNEATPEAVSPTATVVENLETETMNESPSVGSDPSTWAPVIVSSEFSGQTVEMVVGQAGIVPEDFVEPTAKVVVVSSTPSIVEPMQAEDTGEVKTLAGFIARSPGVAVVTIVDELATDPAAKEVLQFMVNVSE